MQRKVTKQQRANEKKQKAHARKRIGETTQEIRKGKCATQEEKEEEEKKVKLNLLDRAKRMK